jgi:hypothetical protein
LDVDDYTWDWGNYDLGSVSNFSLLNTYGTKLETQYSTFNDIEFSVSTASDYWVEIKRPYLF